MSRITSFKILRTRNYRVARNVCGSLFFGLAILCVLRERIFAIRTDWFFLLGINICDFQKVPMPVPSIDNIFVFIEYVQQKYIFSNNKPVPVSLYTVLILNQRQVVIEQTRFLSTAFLCSEFKLENIHSGVHFCGKNVRSNFYLRERVFADRWKNRKNQNPQKSRATRQSLNI